MRIAALAFGVLAGLVASFILALGGMDAGIAMLATGERQISLIRFGLFVIANMGIFGAALVLAAPLLGGILLVLGAVAWAAAAFFLKHGPDYVMLTPPGLLLLAAALAIVARIRAPKPIQIPRRRPAMAAEDDGLYGNDPRSNDPQDEDRTGIRVGAGFFGHGGTAMPLQPSDEADEPALRGLSQPDQIRGNGDDWRPGSRRPPPRQRPAFRDDDDDYEDEESGFSRFARGLSGVLSFGLYAALAGAAVLIIWNVRTGNIGPAAVAKVEPSSFTVAANVGPASSSAAPVLTSSSTPAAPVLSSSGPSSEAVAQASSPPSAPPAISLLNGVQRNGGLGGLVVQGDDTLSSTAVAEASGPEQPTEDASSSEPSSASSSAEPPAEGDLGATPTPTTGGLMPFTMPPRMAAERLEPPPKRTTTTTRSTPPADAGI